MRELANTLLIIVTFNLFWNAWLLIRGDTREYPDQGNKQDNNGLLSICALAIACWFQRVMNKADADWRL